jgi:hypothetical protein
MDTLSFTSKIVADSAVAELNAGVICVSGFSLTSYEEDDIPFSNHLSSPFFITVQVYVENFTSFLPYFRYFEKMEVGLCDRHAVCWSVNNPRPYKFRMPGPIPTKLGM